MGRLDVNLCGIRLDNPVIPASGTFGYGYEFAEYYDINMLGTFACKGTTVDERYGNPLPRIAECSGGLLNSVGLQNPGIHNVMQDEIPKLKKVFSKKFIANISGFSIDEYVELAKRCNEIDEIGWIEVNVSCPNVSHGGMSFGTDEENIFEITSSVKKVTNKPVIVKLTPNVTDIVSIAKSAENAGADAVSLINTLFGMRIDIKSRRPILANKMGGLSGNAVFPVSVRMVYQVSQAVKIPVIGIGGISSAEHVIEMMLAGATAVQVGSANLVNPFACKEIIENLEKTMDKYKIENLKDIVGGSYNG